MTKKSVVPKKASNKHKRPTMVSKFRTAMLKAGATKEFVRKAIKALKPVKIKPLTLTPQEVQRITAALQLNGRIVVAKGKGIKCFTLAGYEAAKLSKKA